MANILNQQAIQKALEQTQIQLNQSLQLLDQYQLQLEKTMAIVEKLTQKSLTNKADLSNDQPQIKRIYIRGCPRSGNTLMLYLCSIGFQNSYILTEQDIPTLAKSHPDKITFATLPSPQSSPEKQEQANHFLDQSDAAIIFMMRDPRDVLVSEHGKKPGEFWVKSPQRWIDNALILEKIQDHPRVIIVKYEDLVTEPNQLQKQIAGKLGLTVNIPFSDSWQHFELTANATKSLNGLRKLESSRIANWRNDIKKKEYINNQLQKYPEMTTLMAKFSYNPESISLVTSEVKSSEENTLKPVTPKKKSFILKPIPLLTPEAIKFLEEFCQTNDHPRILEFGSGGSTAWLSKLTKNLVSIEHDKGWYQKVKQYLSNEPGCYPVDLKLLAKPYDRVCNEFPDEFFDLIIVDGRDRVKCLTSSVRILKKGGIMMMDDAQRERYQEAHSLLKDWPFTRTVSPARETHWWKKFVRK